MGDLADGNATLAHDHERERLRRPWRFEHEVATAPAALRPTGDGKLLRQRQDRVGAQRIDCTDFAELGADGRFRKVSAMGKPAGDRRGALAKVQGMDRVVDQTGKKLVAGKPECAPPDGEQGVEKLEAPLGHQTGELCRHIEERKPASRFEDDGLKDIAIDCDFRKLALVSGPHCPEDALPAVGAREGHADKRNEGSRCRKHIFGFRRQVCGGVPDQHSNIKAEPECHSSCEFVAEAPDAVVCRHALLLKDEKGGRPTGRKWGAPVNLNGS
ncbi:hypothetical protein D9M68_420390 [compost metagenome]